MLNMGKVPRDSIIRAYRSMRGDECGLSRYAPKFECCIWEIADSHIFHVSIYALKYVTLGWVSPGGPVFVEQVLITKNHGSAMRDSPRFA